MTTTISERLLAAAVADAHDELAIADTLDGKDVNALAASHAGLEAILRRVLWTIGEDQDTRDRAADVADQVAAEDGHRFVGVPFQWPVAA